MAARCVGRLWTHSTKFLLSRNPRVLQFSSPRSLSGRHVSSPRTLSSDSGNQDGKKAVDEDSDDPTQNTNEERTERNLPIGLTVTQGPIGWLTKTVNLWLLKRFFDLSFREGEFLHGAKHALCHVSSLVSQRSFSDMVGLVADSIIEDIKDAVQTKEPGPAVEKGDILSAKIKEVGLGYIEEGRKKQIHIDVVFVCSPLNKGLSTKQVGNVKIVRIHHPRVLCYTFRKNFSVDEPGEWLVVGLDF